MMEILNNVFEDNFCGSGSGFYCNNCRAVVVKNCTFLNNKGS